MKIERLIGILSVLLQNEKVTAPFLAEKFEVSRRTINRDIEDICKAGIPIVTTQGVNGGISIMEGFKIDKTLLTNTEMQAILAGLKSLDSIAENNKYKTLIDKLSPHSSSIYKTENNILIDLSSYYKESLAPKISIIHKAINEKYILNFDYHSPYGESKRSIEPYLLVFQWASWYLWGYCLEKSDFRLFKLNRMLKVEHTNNKFEPRELPKYELQMEKVFPQNIKVTALFESSAKWRLIDEYGLDSFTEQEDGKLLFKFGFNDKNHVFSWIFSFGTQVELIEPKELRKELKDLINKIGDKYI